jgi:hypothetical protein
VNRLPNACSTISEDEAPGTTLRIANETRRGACSITHRSRAIPTPYDSDGDGSILREAGRTGQGAPLLASTSEENQIAVWIAHNERPRAPWLRLQSLMELNSRGLKLEKQRFCVTKRYRGGQ